MALVFCDVGHLVGKNHGLGEVLKSIRALEVAIWV
jgi:hypothetical protein